MRPRTTLFSPYLASSQEGNQTFPVPLYTPTLSFMPLHLMFTSFVPPQQRSIFKLPSQFIWLAPEIDSISMSRDVKVPCDFPNIMMLRATMERQFRLIDPEVINFCDLNVLLSMLPACTVRLGAQIVPSLLTRLIYSDFRSPKAISLLSPNSSKENGFDLIFFPTGPDPCAIFPLIIPLMVQSSGTLNLTSIFSFKLGCRSSSRKYETPSCSYSVKLLAPVSPQISSEEQSSHMVSMEILQVRLVRSNCSSPPCPKQNLCEMIAHFRRYVRKGLSMDFLKIIISFIG